MYAKIKDGVVVSFPYGTSEFIADNNNTNYGPHFEMAEIFPHTDVAAQGFECVAVQTPQPPEIDDKTSRLEQSTQPSLVNGQWVLPWVVVQKTAEELQVEADNQSRSVRSQRNSKLASSDWTQGKDIPDSVSQPWAAYRQALRDLPTQVGFPWNIQWPNKPE